MEKQQQYSRTITAKEMFEVSAGFGHQKVMENNHKDNLLGRDLENLYQRFCEEVAEYKKAFRIYERDPTPKNKKSLDREAGDVNAFMSAIMCKTGGYDILVRE